MGINFHNSQNSRDYRIRVIPYCREFKQPLNTHHGAWTDREGIWIQLSDRAKDRQENPRGNQGWGEIAPLPWFGSENLTEALQFCQSFSGIISDREIASIPDHFPACQFGFESALMTLQSLEIADHRFEYCGLLPTGRAALNRELPVWNLGYSTFKWKIAVQEIEKEIALFQELVSLLPEGVQLRLDANGGLSEREAHQWLQACENTPVEFLEQPLKVSQFDVMQRLSVDYATPVALDESVATFSQLVQCYERGWRGVMVVKPAISGFPSRLREFCALHTVDIVLSSVLETAIARQAILNLAATLPNLHRPLGFGTNHWFQDKLE